ncbi:MAG TPA: hypothetical protein VF669_02725 [Tepidisphaeraceae bacterium]
MLCAATFQSEVNWRLAALDAAFHGTSNLLIEDGRLKLIDLARMLYAFCGSRFDTGDARFGDIETLIRIRNELIHDKPLERLFDDISKKKKQWRERLRARVPDLDWVPKVRKEHVGEPFVIAAEAAVQAIMVYPVAKWAADATDHVVRDMRQMVIRRTEGVRVVADGLLKFKKVSQPGDVAAR